jgi:hypothetical protein
VSESEVRKRLQARVPDFSMSPDPGGRWNWLIGVLALGVASGTLVLLTRRAVARGPSLETIEDDGEEATRWEELLDDELINSDL